MNFTDNRKVKWLVVIALAILILVSISVWPRSTAVSSPVPVRFVEGAFHGFLILRTDHGDPIAFGDLRQIGAGGKIKSHMSFRFEDGSILDETATYTEDRVFTLQTYHLIQRGPVFEEDTDASLDRASGNYRVKTRDRKDGKEDEINGTLDLPADVYNGMILTVLKNLGKGEGGSIHIVAFTPKPEIIELEIQPSGREKVSFANTSKAANRYILHPELGTAKKILATLGGRVPLDNYLWVLADEVPTFVKFRGSLFVGGPIWRIELTSPESEFRRDTIQ
jgi:hypothetical protein